MTPSQGIDLSIVIPIRNEAESIHPLVEQIEAALAPLPLQREVILIDDGSTDGSWDRIQSLAENDRTVIGLKLARNYGQTAALMAGIDRSRGEVVVTMDGDLQNDPADIPQFLAKIDEGYEIVTGWRRKRRDRLFSRRLPSMVANWLVRRITGTTIRDQGCALKAYRGEILRSMSLYSDFHRFVVPLTQMGGARVTEVETHHRPREFGQSKYGIGRTLRVVADLTTLLMITKFGDRLLLWFLLLSLPPLLIGTIAVFWTLWATISANTTSLLVPIGTVMICFQAFFAAASSGFLAERIRHLAPSTRRRGNRILATVSGFDAGFDSVVMIRNLQATRLTRRPPITPEGMDGADL